MRTARDGSVVGVDLDEMRLACRVVPEQVSRSYNVRLEARGDVVLVSAVGDHMDVGIVVSDKDPYAVWRAHRAFFRYVCIWCGLKVVEAGGGRAPGRSRRAPR